MFQRGCKVRISREVEQIFEGDLASLKRFKDDFVETDIYVFFICSQFCSRIRTDVKSDDDRICCRCKVDIRLDDQGRRVKEAGPSMPVEILGLSSVPEAGETFVAMDTEKEARAFAETYISEGRTV